MSHAAIDDLIARFAAAQESEDQATLKDLLADDFRLVGPLGFVLGRDEWLEQYGAGNLHYSRLTIEDRQLRTYGDVAVVVAVQEQEGDYQGRPVDGRFRVTLIVHADDGQARIVGAHLSPIAAPPTAS